MPVWHAKTKAARESGELTVVGITQEQHPERCRLFAQWKGLDWPILWDPFNLTGSSAVPHAHLVDEEGIVRSMRLNDDALAAFMQKNRGRRAGKKKRPTPHPHDVIELDGLGEDSPDRPYYRALSDLLWSGTEKIDAAVDALTKHAEEREDDAAARFRLGVAIRLRYDSERRREGDFQSAVDHWTAAMGMNPNQYIWRRRIQQYGPRLDKPYPFYDWVETARAEISARGETPVELKVPLSGAETASRSTKPLADAGPATSPDPDGKIHADDGWIRVDSAVVFDSKRSAPVARVHLSFRPESSAEIHWNNEAEPMRVWIESGGLPDGTVLEKRLLEHANAPTAVSSETRRFELEVQLPEDSGAVNFLSGYALFNACKTADGQCTYLRRDFTVELRLR